jgi:hypothetical protein
LWSQQVSESLFTAIFVLDLVTTEGTLQIDSDPDGGLEVLVSACALSYPG